MQSRFFDYLKNFDWILFSATMLLVCFGLAEIYSIALSNERLGMENFNKQLLFAGVGLVSIFSLAFIDFYTLRSLSVYFYFIGIFLLVGVLIFGKTVRGTTGWFEIFGFSLQPVEFIKIVLIIFLARYFSGVSIKLSPLKHLLFSGLGAGFLAGLVLFQPDFGSALLLFLLWSGMVVVSGFDKKYLVMIVVALLITFLSGWLFFFEDYQKDRLMTFFNPDKDSLQEGYNVNQAMIAVGSGGLIGQGIGFGSQSQLKFLPESQNDFIFAVIAEELGFLGVSLVVTLFGIIFYRLIRAARKISNDFGAFFLLGTCILLFIEMFINIGMNIGIMPVVGISLPFISSGGSAIVASMIMIGICESIIIGSKLKY
jgi:rod shape determining protein RodA